MSKMQYLKPQFYGEFQPEHTFSLSFNGNDRAKSTQEYPSVILQETSERLKPIRPLNNLIEINNNLRELPIEISALYKPKNAGVYTKNSGTQKKVFDLNPNHVRFYSFQEIRQASPQVLQKSSVNTEVHTPEFCNRSQIPENKKIEKIPSKNWTTSHNTKKRKEIHQRKNEEFLKIFDPVALPKIKKNNSRFDSEQKTRSTPEKISLNCLVELEPNWNSPSSRQTVELSDHPFKFLKKLDIFMKNSNRPQKYYKDQPKIKHEFKIPKDVFSAQ